MSEFDDFAKDYDAALQRGISLSGESKDFFAEGRVTWLIKKLGPRRDLIKNILDFGCGTGTSCPLLKRHFPGARILGVDPSAESLEEARLNHKDAAISFALPDDVPGGPQFDLVFCNGVFHHIPTDQRDAAMQWIGDRLVPGGIFAFWENNPLNIGTQLVMYRIPFDRDAEKILPWNARKLLNKNGYSIDHTSYYFVFPSFLRLFRPLEPFLSRFCLGAQYQVLAHRNVGQER